MTDTVPQANPNGLMHIGAVAAHNIVAALELPQDKVGVVEQAIKDEINAMSSHFTLAIADVQTQYEAEVLRIEREKNDFIAATKARETVAVAEFQAAVKRIKSDFDWLNANKLKVVEFLGAAVVLGVLIGHFV